MNIDNRNTKSVVLKKFEQLLELKYSGSTPKNYLHHVKLFLDFLNKPPNRINNEDILSYNISIRDCGHSFRNGSINAIKAYFNLYLRKKVKGFSSIRPPSRKTLPQVYDFETTKIKIDAITNLKHQLILHLGLHCWFRHGEVRDLKIKNISRKKLTIFIEQSKGCKDGEIDISETTLNLIIKYYREYKPKEFLFEGQSGGRYASINKVCQNHLGFKFHSLRASGANQANILGFPTFDISKKLRHSNIKTTEFYLRPNLKSLVNI